MRDDIQNILLIVLDSWRGHALGAAGDPCIKTPNLDALVRDGVLFRRHYCQAVPCGPSRASLMTGQYMMNHRVVLNGTPMAAEHSNLALELRKAGYDPSLIGFTTSVPDPRVVHWNDPRFRSDTTMDGWTVVRSFKTSVADMASEYLRYLNSLGYDVSRGYQDLFELGADDDELRTGTVTEPSIADSCEALRHRLVRGGGVGSPKLSPARAVDAASGVLPSSSTIHSARPLPRNV